MTTKPTITATKTTKEKFKRGTAVWTAAAGVGNDDGSRGVGSRSSSRSSSRNRGRFPSLPSSFPSVPKLILWFNVLFCLLVFLPKSFNKHTTTTTTTTFTAWDNFDDAVRKLRYYDNDNDTAASAASMTAASTTTQTTTPATTTTTTTVAYVVSITSCPPKLSRWGRLYDVGSVLATSIKLNSFPIHETSLYTSDLVIITTPQTANTSCVRQLIDAGFTTVKQFDFPIHSNSSPDDGHEQQQDDHNIIQEPPGTILKQQISNDGCCGDRELIKLHVYSLTEYRVAIHLDLDTLLLRPLDPILDAMVYPIDHPKGLTSRRRLVHVAKTKTTSRQPITKDHDHYDHHHHHSEDPKSRYVRLSSATWNYYPNRQQQQSATTDGSNDIASLSSSSSPSPFMVEGQSPMLSLPPQVEAYYTKDYNMLPRGKTKVGIQGGVIIVKPNTTRRDLLIDMVKSGEFYPGRDSKSGWFRSGYGKHIWGSMTVQGLLGYYYNEIEPSTSVELNRCRFNQIAENPRRSSLGGRPGIYPRGTPIDPSDVRYNATYHDEECRDGRGDDEDGDEDEDGCNDVQCQTFPLERTFILHYTYCKSPMNYPDIAYNETWNDHQCSLMHREWFKVRKLLSSSSLSSSRSAATTSNSSSSSSNSDGQGQQQGGTGSHYPSHFYGFCNGTGPENYIPLVPPSLTVQ